MKIRQQRLPHWLKVPLPAGENYSHVKKLISQFQINTVCQSAQCPNISECWGHHTATFMILGDVCTRNCRFCAVISASPRPIDFTEPQRVAEAVKKLALRYAVITSVTRDDLDDGGASMFAETIYAMRRYGEDCQIEVLIPDFKGKLSALVVVFKAKPDVLNHNMETVPSLYKKVRPQADYHRSLSILDEAKKYGLKTKSGLMLGLGENKDEVFQVMNDLRKIDCDFLTLGQYLRPSAQHLPIDRYVTPEEFLQLKEAGIKIGFRHVEAGPLVRSSYHAAWSYEKFSSQRQVTSNS